MQQLTISHPSDAGQRIDRFCKKYLPNAALGGIYKMLRTGKIKVNGKKKDQTYKIKEGDEIAFWISDDEMRELQGEANKRYEEDTEKKTAPKSGISKSVLSLTSILYEDEYLMVLNKPAGLNVHAGDHKTDESNLIDQVQDYLQGRHDSLTFRPALVHRIDRDTSGCILIAKEKNVLESLLSDLQSHKIEKVYHAFVFGVPPKSQDTIRARLLRVEDARDEAKVRVDESGQSAITHYMVLQNGKMKTENQNQKTHEQGVLSHENMPLVSLLECHIETGRTHQIRVHLAHIGCPIIGDKAYGDKRQNSYIMRRRAIARQMLHAQMLVFTHPITKKRLEIEAPYLEDFATLVALIGTQKS